MIKYFNNNKKIFFNAIFGWINLAIFAQTLAHLGILGNFPHQWHPFKKILILRKFEFSRSQIHDAPVHGADLPPPAWRTPTRAGLLLTVAHRNW